MAGPEAIYQQLTILLALATLSHFTIKRFHQPTIVGEIALGILLGPSVLGYYLNLQLFDPNFVSTFAGLGAIFLLFLIGLESDFKAIYTKKNIAVAAGGVLLPFVVGFAIAYVLVPGTAVGSTGTPFTMAIFVGATLTATSTAIAAAVLLDLGLMREPVAQTIMGAAVVDDILGLVLLSIVVGTSHGRLDPVSLVVLVATALTFIGLGMAVGLYFFRKVVVRIQVAGLKLGMKHGGFLIALAIAFLYAFVAEVVGLSAIVGAFLAGTLFASTPLKDDFTEGAGYLGAVFTPIFFISLGLQVNLPSIGGTSSLIVFGSVLAVVALLTKVIGCGVPARLVGMTPHEALAVGWGMTPRGEVGLIVALAALTAGVISDALFSIIVVVMVLVSVFPAPLFKRSLANLAEAKNREAASPAKSP
jgi:Kef-type K+ transport system membrane component KefB